jgi:hypothetical protein
MIVKSTIVNVYSTGHRCYLYFYLIPIPTFHNAPFSVSEDYDRMV